MSKLYLMRDDEFTLTFSCVGEKGVSWGDKPQWIDFKSVTIPANGSDRNFLISAAVLHSGEREQRGVVVRKIKKNTRNISSRLSRSYRYLGWVRNPEGMADDDRKVRNQVMKEFRAQLGAMIANARKQVSWEGEVPARWSYVVTEDVLDAAEEAGCEAYFDPIGGQRFFADDLAKIESEIASQYPESGSEVIKELKATKTDEHLSMISLTAGEGGALFITMVDPKGHYLKVEAERFVHMIDNHDQPIRLHVFPPKGSRQEVEFAFNENKLGEIIGKFIPEQMKFDIACCQPQGQYSNVYDRSWFYADAEYLMCLWVVLCRLEKDRNRYVQLKSMAEARVEFDPFSVGASLENSNRGGQDVRENNRR